MKSKRPLLIIAATATLSVLAIADHHLEGEKKSATTEFLSTTIDIGCVVSDIEKSVKFYKEAIGFTEVKGFTVPADFAGEVGLTESKQLDIRVLVLGEGDQATKLKLMQIKGGGNKRADHSHIDTTLGFSYITIVVKSTDEALVRLQKAGIKVVENGPVVLPDNLNPELSLTIVRDPDGNLVELVGPNPIK
ncbi:MAG: lactoylglutathione lyase [Verrucomicrobiales bacterium]|jgi:lactoylglutathione lyase